MNTPNTFSLKSLSGRFGWLVVTGSLVLSLLALCASTFATGEAAPEELALAACRTECETSAAPGEATSAYATADRITMEIDLEEGQAIALETSKAPVTINNYPGDQVLVIVEKQAKTVLESNSPASKQVPDVVTIHIARTSKRIQIETLPDPDLNAATTGLSFRILMPERLGYHHVPVTDRYSLSKLTFVVWRALQHGAIEWLTQ
jgi:hypothetical protein